MTYPDEQEPAKTWKRPKPKLHNIPVEVPSLWDAPAPSVPRATSEGAADRQTVPKRENDRERILRALAYATLTRDEIATLTGISPNTVRPRIVELITVGHVTDTKQTRRTATGSPAAVCEATLAGLHWLGERE
jgi:hypothetical protein